MPYFEWKDSLSIGIRTIDVQHKKLVEMVNALHDAAEASNQHCPAPDLVERLKAYAAEHFHIEEGYMQAFAYPELAAHQKEHEAFTDAVNGFASDCVKGTADPAVVLDFLKTWLTSHITGVDIKMGRFLEDYLR